MEIATTVYAPEGRGCGFRDEGSSYLCCGTSKYGSPIESFILDPCLIYPDIWQRGYRLATFKGEEGEDVNHVIIFVGRSDYPSPWDFVEEARRFGISRKVNSQFPFELLTPGKSQMLFCHARAIPVYSYNLNYPQIEQTKEGRPLYYGLKGCSYRWEDTEEESYGKFYAPGYHAPYGKGDIPCTFALKDLAAFHSATSTEWETNHIGKHKGTFTAQRPSFSYSGIIPESIMSMDGDSVYFGPDKDIMNPRETILDVDTQYQLGIFMAVPITHVEAKNYLGEKEKKNAETHGYPVVILEY